MFAFLQHETSQARERQMNEPAPVGQGAGSRPVASRGVHPLHVGIPATRDITAARRQKNELVPVGHCASSRPVASPGVHPLHVRPPATRDIAGTRGRQMNETSPVSGEGRGFEACGVTGRPSPACWLACNTRHRRHTRRQMKGPAPAGEGAGSRPVASLGEHLLHVRAPATRSIAGTRGVR